MDRYGFVSDVLAAEIAAAVASHGNRTMTAAQRKSIRAKVEAIFSETEASMHSGWIDTRKDDSWVRAAADALPPNATGMNGMNLAVLKDAVSRWWETASKNPQDKLSVLEMLHPDDSIVNSLFSMLKDKSSEDIAAEFPSLLAGGPGPLPPAKEPVAPAPSPEAEKDEEPKKKTDKSQANPSVRKPINPLAVPVDEFESPEVPGVPGDGRIM